MARLCDAFTSSCGWWAQLERPANHSVRFSTNNRVIKLQFAQLAKSSNYAYTIIVIHWKWITFLPTQIHRSFPCGLNWLLNRKRRRSLKSLHWNSETKRKLPLKCCRQKTERERFENKLQNCETCKMYPHVWNYTRGFANFIKPL